MCLVNWVGIVTLSRDAKVDALIIPFTKSKMAAPGAYSDTPLVPQCVPTFESARLDFIETCRKSVICTGMYKVCKTWVCMKLKHLQVSIYITSLGFWVEFLPISQWGEWHFRKISVVWYMTQIGKFLKLNTTLFQVLFHFKFYSFSRVGTCSI